MKITTKVTKRDIMLLIILGVFLVAAGLWWFVIHPLDEQLQSISGEIEALRTQSDLYAMQSGQLSGVQSQLQGAESDYASLAESFIADTTEEAISRRVVDTVSAYGGKMLDFRIAKDAGASKDSEYVSYPSYGEGSSKDNTKILEGIFSYSVNIVISGNKDDLQSLVDLWAGGSESVVTEGEIAYPQICISSFSWKDADKNNADSGSSVLTISLRIFTIEPIEEGDN